MAENSFCYDGSLCIACRSCQVACKQWNYLPGEETEFFAAAGGYQNPSDLSPKTWTIMKFHEVAENGDVQWLFRRHHCFHCTDAPCVEVCPVEPVKAMTRHPEFKTIYVNQDLCVGCGACEDACPYGVPHVDEDLERSRKCTSCFDRVANGLIPACAKTCPTQAIRYGPKEEMYAAAGRRAQELREQGFTGANVYGLEQLGGLHSIYVLPAKLKIYGLPAKPEWDHGKLERIKQQAKEKYAAWRANNDLRFANLETRGPVGAALVFGLAGAGLKRLAERKDEIARADTGR